MILNRCFSYALVAIFSTIVLFGQESMEGIVAVVGREIVLKSDIDGQIELIAQRDPHLDKRDPKLRQSVLDALINERLIMTKAIEDSIEVTDDEITNRMEYQIQSLIQQFGSEKRIEEIYGMSMTRVRREFRDEIRKRLLVEKLQQKQFGSVKASRADVEGFFTRYRDSLPVVPERVDLYHIVKYVKPSEEKSKEAYTFAMRIRDSILSGKPFADFARRYSGDPGSAENGGDLGSVEKGKFVAAFEAAAFGLEPDEISLPVETPFGWHIIQLISKTTSSITSRHILIRVGQSDEDRDRVKQALAEIKKRVEAGEDFESMARALSEEKETQGFGGAMGQIELVRLPEEMRMAIEALPDGGVSVPLPYAADPTKPGFHLLFRKSMIPAHAATVDSDYKQIEQMASYEKKQRLEAEWVLQLRRSLYWEIR